MRAQLDGLVAAGRVTGYTLEEDAGYLYAENPTLTYRMYAQGPESHRNLGEFAAAVAELGPRMRLSRVEGVVADGGRLWRSRQLCLTAEFPGEQGLAAAADLVHRRFTALPGAAAGSWRLPDVRMVGGRPLGTVTAYAHHWAHADADAVVLTLQPAPPLHGAVTRRLRILDSWLAFLERREVAVAS